MRTLARCWAGLLCCSYHCPRDPARLSLFMHADVIPPSHCCPLCACGRGALASQVCCAVGRGHTCVAVVLLSRPACTAPRLPHHAG
jgi:hypothetical protein